MGTQWKKAIINIRHDPKLSSFSPFCFCLFVCLSLWQWHCYWIAARNGRFDPTSMTALWSGAFTALHSELFSSEVQPAKCALLRLQSVRQSTIAGQVVHSAQCHQRLMTRTDWNSRPNRHRRLSKVCFQGKPNHHRHHYTICIAVKWGKSQRNRLPFAWRARVLRSADTPMQSDGVVEHVQNEI